MSLQAFFQLLGGVGLLIYGIKTMGDALQDLAGDRLRRLISAMTNNRFKGVAVGAVVTTIIQSSSATTVMVVSFVHCGLMSLQQAVGVILGANIGTTITAQLIAFKVSDYALLACGVGAALALVGKTRRNRTLGAGILGFGLLFLGMQLMGDSMSFLRGRADLFLPFRRHPILGVLAGTIVTMLVQASSATVGLTMAMASQGLLPLDVAIAIIFGDNIGTTITAILASLAGNRAGKQAAAAHVMFNVLGTCLMLPFLSPYAHFIATTSSDIARQVANAHTFFNVINTCLFLPFVVPYTRFIQRLVPDDRDARYRAGAQYLDRKLISASPAAAVDAIRQEMVRMGALVQEMLADCDRALISDDLKADEDVMQTEKLVNELTHDVVRYATELGQTGLPGELSRILNSCVNGVGDLERVGDHATNLIEMHQFLEDHKLTFSAKGIEEYKEMSGLVKDAVRKATEALEREDAGIAREVLELEDRIDAMEKRLRLRHIERLNRGECAPGAGVVFIDILSNLERVGDHAHNLAYVVLDIVRIRNGEALG